MVGARPENKSGDSLQRQCGENNVATAKDCFSERFELSYSCPPMTTDSPKLLDGQELAGVSGYLQSPPQGNASLAGARQTFPPVLDVTCGTRAMWFNKRDPRCLFSDKRNESNKRRHKTGDYDITVAPDVVADFTKLPFPSETFFLVVFDPPHFEKMGGGEGGNIGAYYGRLFGDWECEIAAGFAECLRVLRENGTLIFKWSSIEIPLDRVLRLAPCPPLFGHISGKREKTHWMTFLKHTGAVAPADSGDNHVI